MLVSFMEEENLIILPKEELLFAFDDLRSGFKMACMSAAEHNDAILLKTMEWHYNLANKKCIELGNSDIPLVDFWEFIKKT